MTYNIDKDAYKDISTIAFQQCKLISKNTLSGPISPPISSGSDNFQGLLKDEGVDYVG